jgi:hypothetical protein
MKNTIRDIVLSEFSIKESDLLSKSRSNNLPQIKQYYSFFLKENTQLNDSTIGYLVGWRTKVGSGDSSMVSRYYPIIMNHKMLGSFLLNEFWEIDKKIKEYKELGEVKNIKTCDYLNSIKEINKIISNNKNTKLFMQEKIKEICKKVI